MSSGPERCAILVVENDADIAYLLRQVLMSLGFKNLTFASNGRDALSKVLEQPFDVILTDWEMRPMSGIDFVRNLRGIVPPPNQFTPVIMVTGRTAIEDVKLARDVGVTEYMAKPFSAKDLVHRLLSVIKNPRQFVIASEFAGPDRRRRAASPPDGTKKREEDGV